MLKAIEANLEIGRLAHCVAYQKIVQENLLKLCDFADLAKEIIESGKDLQDYLWPRVRSKGWNPLDCPEGFDPYDYLEHVPCAVCKKNKRSGKTCRDDYKHEEPNFNWVNPVGSQFPSVPKYSDDPDELRQMYAD